MKIVVYHSSYMCETGCCGHIVESDDDNSPAPYPNDFSFRHPNGRDYFEFAQELVESAFGPEHVKDLDWENCLIYDDD